MAEISRWWLDTIARHRVRGTTWTTYDKQLRLVATHLGDIGYSMRPMSGSPPP